MTQGGFLDDDDVRRLCEGRARADAQEAFLRAEGIPFKRHRNKFTVCWIHVHAWLEGRPPVSFVEPDLSNVN